MLDKTTRDVKNREEVGAKPTPTPPGEDMSDKNKKIETLIKDIYDVVDRGQAEVTDEDRHSFAHGLARIVSKRLNEGTRTPYLRLSNLGQCDRRLYLEINHPELAEPLPADVKLKFLLGDVWEHVLLFLARIAGHRVEGEQDEVILEGVKGHRDAVIDGVTTDVKSASSYAFLKFKDGLTPEKDDFGYLTQIDTYLETGQDDPIVTDKNRAAFLAGDKQLGKLALDIHPRRGVDYKAIIAQKRAMLAAKNPPPRPYNDVPDGKSGNRKLDTVCSYCPVKFACWLGLKQYNYSGKPRFLTVVKREPKVPKAGETLVGEFDNDPF